MTDCVWFQGVDPREIEERAPPLQIAPEFSLNETMMAEEGLLLSLGDLAAENADNICLSAFDGDYFSTLSDDLKPQLLRCMNSGVTNPDSKMGCYACHPDDYDRFAPFFSKALAEYHGVEMPVPISCISLFIVTFCISLLKNPS